MNDDDMFGGQVTDADMAGRFEPTKEENEIYNELLGLLGTPQWEAMRKFSRMMDARTLTALGSIDPFKCPVDIARGQGQRVGFFALEVAVDKEARRRRENNERAKMEQN